MVDICLLHRYQLHVSALMANLQVAELTKTYKQLYLACVFYSVEGGFLLLDGVTRFRV